MCPRRKQGWVCWGSEDSIYGGLGQLFKIISLKGVPKFMVFALKRQLCEYLCVSMCVCVCLCRKGRERMCAVVWAWMLSKVRLYVRMSIRRILQYRTFQKETSEPCLLLCTHVVHQGSTVIGSLGWGRWCPLSAETWSSLLCPKAHFLTLTGSILTWVGGCGVTGRYVHISNTMCKTDWLTQTYCRAQETNYKILTTF